MINAKLRTLREKSNLNIKEISDLSGVPYSTVQKIFADETKNPNADAVYKIVKAMGFTMEELYGDIKEGSGSSDFALQIAIIRDMYEQRISDLKEAHEKHAKTYKTIISVCFGLIIILMFFFIVYFALDYANRDWGIFFRE